MLSSLLVSAPATFLAAALAALLLGAVSIDWLRRSGFASKVREDTPEAHQLKAGTPSMGGLFLVPAACVPMVVGSGFDKGAIGVAIAMLLFAGVGFIDDYLKHHRPTGRGFKARSKLILEFAAGSVIVAWVSLVVGREGRLDALPWVDPLSVGVAAPVVWFLLVLWTANAANITDGLDGLAAGLTVFASAVFVVFGALTDQSGVAVAACALMGAALGFLWYNRRPAKVWMGDTGSLALGAGLATLAITAGEDWLLVVAALPFMADLVSVVLQVAYFQTTKRVYRLAEGKRIFRKAPLHHHFEEGGASEPQVVLGFWLAGLVCALGTIALIVAERRMA